MCSEVIGSYYFLLRDLLEFVLRSEGNKLRQLELCNTLFYETLIYGS